MEFSFIYGVMNACKGTAGLGLAVRRYNVCILVIEGILLEQRELFTSETSYLPPGLEVSLSLSDSFAVQAHSFSCCSAGPNLASPDRGVRGHRKLLETCPRSLPKPHY
jgi:hypothetical protein